jgi:signal transduction histidine kinase
MTESNKGAEHLAFIQLLGRVSHDLRGPAGITSGVLDELESRRQTDADAGLFAMARRGLAGVLRIAERLEMVAQLDAGPLHLERLPIDLSALVTRASEDAKVIQKRKAIAVTLDLPTEMRANVDQRWLGVTILEIIANAIRHAKTSVRVSSSHDAGVHRIVVEDDGRGFTEETLAAIALPRLSEPFARSGLGVSLSIARDVVGAHGGEIRFSKAGAEGARVEIDFKDA